MNEPTRRPVILKAASVAVALMALLGFVAAAAAGAKKSSGADAGTGSSDAGVTRRREFFPASKSAGGFYPHNDSQPQPKQAPVQQQVQPKK